MCAMMADVAETVMSISSSMRKKASFLGLLMRATVRSTLKSALATWQATRLSSSSPVTARSMFARLVPALLVDGRFAAVAFEDDVAEFVGDSAAPGRDPAR